MALTGSEQRQNEHAKLFAGWLNIMAAGTMVSGVFIPIAGAGTGKSEGVGLLVVFAISFLICAHMSLWFGLVLEE